MKPEPTPEERADQRRFLARYPCARARLAADRAIDALGEHEPMTRYVDTWIAAYTLAAGTDAPPVSRRGPPRIE